MFSASAVRQLMVFSSRLLYACLLFNGKEWSDYVFCRFYLWFSGWFVPFGRTIDYDIVAFLWRESVYSARNGRLNCYLANNIAPTPLSRIEKGIWAVSDNACCPRSKNAYKYKKFKKYKKKKICSKRKKRNASTAKKKSLFAYFTFVAVKYFGT